MSKTIDVREGDQFTMFPDGTLCQYRNGYREWRGVAPHAATEWRDNGNNPAGADPDEIYVSKETAFRLLKSWVYTPAKPEHAVICSNCRTFGCDDHVPDAGKMVPDLAATVKRLEERVAKLEAATTPAKVRVVLPEIPGWATDDRVTAGWNSCIVQVKLALSAAGIDVVKEAGK